jgi:hypothetical protein
MDQFDISDLEKLLEISLDFFENNAETSAEGYKHDCNILWISNDDVNVAFRNTISSLLFEFVMLNKVMQNGYSLLRIHPESSYYYKYKIENWDLSAMWSICRTIVESYLVMNYMSDQNKSDEELQVRKWLYLYHNKLDRIHGLLEEKKRDDFIVSHIRDYAFQTREILSYPVCLEKIKGMSIGKRKDFRTSVSKNGFLISLKQMSLEAGINQILYKQFYRISSWYIHSKSQAMSHLLQSVESKEKLMNSCYETAFAFIYLTLCYYCNICVGKLIPPMDPALALKANRFANNWIPIKL